MTDMKPHLACDVDEDKLTFPKIAFAKIDGVRGINLTGTLTGRSLKEFKNKFVTSRYSGELFKGFDGELALGNSTSSTLCRDTTGFVNRKTAKEGKPTESNDLVWWVFDLLLPSTVDLGYDLRHSYLKKLLESPEYETLGVRLAPSKWVQTLEELQDFEDECLDMGYEGVILRCPTAAHKSGRATVKLGAYLRIKRFIDVEGIVVGLIEALENTNEAKTNKLGRTERSTHKENMVPKGMVGMLKMQLLADVVYRDKLLFKKGELVDVGPGAMTHEERTHFWHNPNEIVNEVGKVKLFPHGTKDKPRFPTWLGFRVAEDMSED